MKKKFFAMTAVLFLSAIIVFWSTELSASAAMSKERIFSCFTFTKMISGGMNDELESGETPSKEFVYHYIINSGLLDKYTNKNTWTATLTYTQYNSLVKECFAKYPSMKTYLADRGEYNSKTGKVKLFAGGGYGDPVYPVYIKSTNSGKTLRGVWVDAENQTRTGIEGFDYYVDEYTDELGNVVEYASEILIHVKVTLDKNNKITSYKIVDKSEALKNLSYKVTYNTNGGSGTISSQTKAYNACVKLTTSKPTRKGYTFTGWSTNPDATVAEYKAGSNYEANHSVKLYAVWASNTYTISYNKNGGTGSMSSQSMTYNKAANIKKNEFTRTGYRFKKWNTKSDGTGTSYNEGQSVKNLTSTNGNTVKLYAIWEKAFKVTFDPNGGSVSTKSKYVYKSEQYGTLPVPVRNGYYFLGWFNSSDKKIGETSKFNLSKNQTLEAMWVKIPEMEVKTNVGDFIQIEWTLPSNAKGANIYYNGEKIDSSTEAEDSYSCEVEMGKTHKFYVRPYRTIGGTKYYADNAEASKNALIVNKPKVDEKTWKASMTDSEKNISMNHIYQPENLLVMEAKKISDATPQGICATDKYFLVTLYKEKSAYIVVLDKKSHKGLAVLRLTGTAEFVDLASHVGGIAYDGDGYIWVSGTNKKKVFRIDLKVIDEIVAGSKRNDKTYALITGKDYKEFSTEYKDDKYANPSFLTCHNGSLYVGTFSKSGAGQLREFEIGKNSLTYKKAMTIPNKIQGAYFMDDETLILSKSYGRENISKLYNFKVSSAGLEVKSMITLPPMSEEIVITDNYLYILYESSAQQYRNGCPDVQDNIWAINLTNN